MLTRGPDHDAATAALWAARDPATLEGLVHSATLAANSHSAQAWRFRPTAEGVAILPDMSRALPVADGNHHHLNDSLGCAAENLMLAAAAAARSSALGFSPEGAVRVDIALGQKASVDPLFETILVRQCTRSEYNGRAVPSEDLTALEVATRVDGAEVMLTTDPALIAQVLELILTANVVQVSDPTFAAELKSWLHFNTRAAIETGDGLFSATSGNPTLPTVLGRFMFDRFFTLTAEYDRYDRQVRSSAGLAIIHSDRDAPALGIRHAHLNQPVEVPSTRPQLQSLLGFGERGPDMVLRFGYAPPMPRSLRRSVVAVIDA